MTEITSRFNPHAKALHPVLHALLLRCSPPSPRAPPYHPTETHGEGIRNDPSVSC